MKGKLTLLAGVGIGYLLGSKKNREQAVRQAKAVWSNPKVQEQVSHAQDVVREQAPVVQDKLTTAAAQLKDKASATVGSGSGEHNGSTPGYTPRP
ncbi:hypothetical protein GCM10027446_18350 [Angustibacter peucedani]